MEIVSKIDLAEQIQQTKKVEQIALQREIDDLVKDKERLTKENRQLSVLVIFSSFTFFFEISIHFYTRSDQFYVLQTFLRFNYKIIHFF